MINIEFERLIGELQEMHGIYSLKIKSEQKRIGKRW